MSCCPGIAGSWEEGGGWEEGSAEQVAVTLEVAEYEEDREMPAAPKEREMQLGQEPAPAPSRGPISPLPSVRARPSDLRDDGESKVILWLLCSTHEKFSVERRHAHDGQRQESMSCPAERKAFTPVPA